MVSIPKSYDLFEDNVSKAIYGNKISFTDWDSMTGGYETVSELERDGWVEEKAKWEPALGEKYYFPEDVGVTWSSWRNDSIDRQRRDFTGVYPTEKEAIEAGKKIAEFVKGL